MKQIFSQGMDRFIPAQAGNTQIGGLTELPAPVHPRAGGEHVRRPALSRLPTGSSPRRRGTPPPPAGKAARVRFIPAQAGNTVFKCREHKGAAVHPRAGGEHSFSSSFRNSCRGSSPRRRGTLMLGEGDAQDARFIPAQAGNTS
ncbi:Hypothetical protein GbCGDNIH3_1369 [Granulibacter bethesdensis]|uniref:Uncharacterized protein n=1 Tax=Granulibacter bethesdensis TaxID=364410 RepID=A0AAN0RE62_9PROT|nr:Hypothetical protein GbCGDNIH3_1369 [Granulibacter bethesdensis]